MFQPPSGGCVLKPDVPDVPDGGGAAAFGRLCVETPSAKPSSRAFDQPPSGGCVLKLLVIYFLRLFLPSRLRAAVC